MTAGQIAARVVVPYPAIDVPVPTETARYAMVGALLAYLGGLTFKRPGPQGERFRIKGRNLLPHWPDNEQKLEYPTVSIPGTPGTYQAVGFTPTVDERSYGVYAPRTCLVQLHEYVEILQVTVWAASTGELRAMLAKIEGSLSPMESKHGLKLTTEDYFDRVAYFALVSSVLVEEEVVRGQRRADVMVEGRIPVVRLAAFGRMQPRVQVDVVEASESLDDWIDIEV